MLQPLDPAMQAYIDNSKRFTPGDRSLGARRSAFLQACRHCTPPPPEGWRIEDIDLQGLRVRCYQPAGRAPEGGWATLLYIHGGGWDLGNLDTHDWFAYTLAQRVRLAIVAVEYRLAPEYAYPAPLEDCLKAWAALRTGKVHANLSQTTLMVAGDSAGGTLAAGLCRALLNAGQAQPLGQLLAYPVLTASQHLPSMQEHAQAPLLTVAGLMQSLQGFVPNEAERTDPCAMPLEADDFAGLAPALVVVARVDPLCDHGIDYYHALSAHGVPAELWVGEGMVHSSLRAFGVAEVEQAWVRMAAQLQRWAQG
ncbi:MULTISPECIES: alpha/beta hydrolase [unclassified Pseudomonas]|uniref:alpha/beta hydrolase n=1 Tax=unclassified Pseudomonas TaxID=196821 RepID=UPI003132D97C